MTKSVFDDKEYVQRAVLGFIVGASSGCRRPGSFFCLLIDTCMHADSTNTERLRKGFPMVVGAVRAYQQGKNLDIYTIIRNHIN